MLQALARQTKFLQWDAREPPYRIALVNGFIGNAWRIQMVKTAKAFVKDPAVAPLIKEFKVVSTGTNVNAQLAAIEDFIKQGFDGIVTLAVSPKGFDHVIELADKHDVLLVPFDGVLDTDKVVEVNEDQTAMGRSGAVHRPNPARGKVLEVRGLEGNSTERDRHQGFRAVHGRRRQEVRHRRGGRQLGHRHLAKGDRRCARRARPFRRRVHARRIGRHRAGDDRRQAFVRAESGEGENEYRKQIADHYKDGLKGMSYGQSPAWSPSPPRRRSRRCRAISCRN